MHCKCFQCHFLWSEQFCFAMCFCCNLLPQEQRAWANCPWIESSKILSQYKSFFFIRQLPQIMTEVIASWLIYRVVSLTISKNSLNLNIKMIWNWNHKNLGQLSYIFQKQGGQDYACKVIILTLTKDLKVLSWLNRLILAWFVTGNPVSEKKRKIQDRSPYAAPTGMGMAMQTRVASDSQRLVHLLPPGCWDSSYTPWFPTLKQF